MDLYALCQCRRIWSICAFDQMRCTFGQMHKPNPNPSPDLNPSPNTISRALHDWPNVAQFVKCCAIDKLISGAARLVKCAIDQMCATSTPFSHREITCRWWWWNWGVGAVDVPCMFNRFTSYLAFCQHPSDIHADTLNLCFIVWVIIYWNPVFIKQFLAPCSC